jgi:hypothetical protein
MLVPEFNEVGMSALIKALVQVLDLPGFSREEKMKIPALLRIEIAGLLNEGATSDTVIAAEALRRATQKIPPGKAAPRKSAPVKRIKEALALEV